MIRFIDVSAVQGAIQFDKVAAAGIRAVVVKCTEGMGGADPRYQANVRAAREAANIGYGLEVGAYHFCKASLSPGMQNLRDDAVGEMQRFHALANFDAGPINFPPVLDFEIFDGQPPAMAAEWLRVAILETEQLWGRTPVIYTGAPMAAALALVPDLVRCPLWIAAYPQSKLPSGAWSPAITWEQAAARKFPTVAPWKAALMHQFSGGSNTLPGNYVDGIKPFVDCNLFNGGESEWRTFLGLDVVHPPEVGSPAGEDDPPPEAA